MKKILLIVMLVTVTLVTIAQPKYFMANNIRVWDGDTNKGYTELLQTLVIELDVANSTIKFLNQNWYEGYSVLGTRDSYDITDEEDGTTGQVFTYITTDLQSSVCTVEFVYYSDDSIYMFCEKIKECRRWAYKLTEL
jgi:hypothetical protein